MHRPILAAVAALSIASPAATQPKPGPKPTSDLVVQQTAMSSAGVRAVMSAAVEEANRNGWGSSIAIVDASGRLLAFHRTDGAPLGTIDVAQRKAATSVQFKMPTDMVGQMVARGGAAMLTLGDFVAVPGGYPIVRDGQVIGGIGVSGGMAGEDDVIAKSGLAALTR